MDDAEVDIISGRINGFGERLVVWEFFGCQYVFARQHTGERKHSLRVGLGYRDGTFRGIGFQFDDFKRNC